MFSIIVCISIASITFVLFVFPLKVHLLVSLVGHHSCSCRTTGTDMPHYDRFIKKKWQPPLFFFCSENRSDKLLHRRCVFLILSFSRGLNSNACHCQEMEDKFDMIGSFTVEILLSVSILSLLMPIGLSMWNQIMVCHAFLLALGKVHFLSKGPRLPYKLSNLWKILYMHLSLSLSLLLL